MENTEILKELDTLKTELNGRIDSVIKKYEDSIKPKFEIGKWYKVKNNNDFLLCPTNIKNTMDDVTGYGFNTDGYWSNESDYWGLDGCYEATPQEVQEALEKEAVKRGFKEGVKFKPVSPNCYNDAVGVCGKDFHYYETAMYGHEPGLCSGKNWIFQNGTWAEIISEPKTIDELAIEFDEVFSKNQLTLAKTFKQFITENNFKLPD